MTADKRALAWRFVNEGPDKIGRILEKRERGSALSEKEQACLQRLERPLSAREIEKWQQKMLTPQQVGLLCEDRMAADFFEDRLTIIIRGLGREEDQS